MNNSQITLKISQVGALSLSVGESSHPYDGDLTFIGRVLAGLPVDIRIGKLLILGHLFGLLEECIIIGQSVLSSCIYFVGIIVFVLFIVFVVYFWSKYI